MYGFTRRGMRTILRESFVPVLGVFALLWGALAVLRYLAELSSREPAVIRIAADETPASVTPLGAGSAKGAQLSAAWAEDPSGAIVPVTDANQSGAARDQEDESDLAALQAGKVLPGDLRRATELASRDSLDAALAAIATTLHANPHRSSAWFASAVVLYRQGDPDAAIEAYTKCAKLSAGRAKALPLYNLGCLYRDVGRAPEAIAAFERALEQRPDYREARLNRAILVAGQPGRQAEALRLYDQLLRLAPNYAEAWYNRGVLGMGAGRADSARADFEHAVAFDSSFVKAWFNLGLLYGRAGRTRDAERAYRKAIAAEPEHLQARLNLAVLLAGRSETREEARRLYDDLVHISPAYAGAYYNRGVLALEEGRVDAARADFERAVAVDSGLARAWFNLGLLHARADRRAEAAASYRRAVTADPTHLRARLNLAVSLARLGRLATAAEVYHDLLTLDPSYASAWYNLAIVYINLKDNYSAKEIYNKLVSIDAALAEKLRKYLR